jgi:hypothetical protein
MLGWQDTLTQVVYLGQRINQHGWIHTESNTTIAQVHCICCLPIHRPPPSFLFIVSEDVGGMPFGRLCVFVSSSSLNREPIKSGFSLVLLLVQSIAHARDGAINTVHLLSSLLLSS